MGDEAGSSNQLKGRRSPQRTSEGGLTVELAYSFSTSERPELAQVGGKAMSLILMTQQGFPVPAGFVLSVAFFQPWLDQIQRSPEWNAALDSSSEDLKRKTMRVEELCADLELDELRGEILAQALAALEAGNGPASYAVRSSSPEEDLEGLSFAGGYETVLGVKKENLENALRRSFASCFDERVFVYKQEHGLPVDEPRIAVIVQKQIAADTAGVAFSLNPLNNCYDEAVINANFGIGESVVAGRVSPDTFAVDKLARTILERKIGAKETSVWLAADGGTYEQPSSSRGELCLSSEQVLRLTEMLGRVEDYYGRPIDIEWAFADGKLHLLQARPITAYFPVPEIMLTPPGEPKRLYNDVTLTKWGMQEPLSVMGMDFMAIANAATLRFSLGENTTDETLEAMRLTVQGRTYGNLSNALKMEGKKRFLSAFRAIDVLSAEAVANMDDAEYIPKKLPPAMRGLVFSALRQNMGTIVDGLRALKDPARYRQKYLDDVERCMKDLEALWREELTTREFAERTINIMVATVSAFMSVLFAAEMARSRIKKLFKDEEPELRDKVVYLERALPDNVTIEMGLAMYRLASFSEVSECTSGTEFAARLSDGSFSPEFLGAWDGFMAEYGFRGPMEMDPAATRFYEQPELFFEQLRAMAENATPENSPVAIFERAKAQREEACRDLLRAAGKRGKRKAKQFESLYEVLMTLGGSRETPSTTSF